MTMEEEHAERTLAEWLLKSRYFGWAGMGLNFGYWHCC